MTNCDRHREENPKLLGVQCCSKCHRTSETQQNLVNWVCCNIWNQENNYRPARATPPTKS